MNVETLNFMLGAIVALIFPLINLSFKSFKKWNELRKIKKMLFEEYVNPLEKCTEKLDFKGKENYQKEVFRIIKRLNYVLENEIAYLNSENQFKIIRMIEYTKSYLANIHKILMGYTYQSIHAAANEEDMIQDRTKIKELTKHYKDTIDKYSSLEIDQLVK